MIWETFEGGRSPTAALSSHHESSHLGRGTVLADPQTGRGAGDVSPAKSQKAFVSIFLNSFPGLSLCCCLKLYSVHFNFQMGRRDRTTMTAGFKKTLI